MCVEVFLGKGMLSDKRMGWWSNLVFSSVREVECELLMDGGRRVEFKGWLSDDCVK